MWCVSCALDVRWLLVCAVPREQVVERGCWRGRADDHADWQYEWQHNSQHATYQLPVPACRGSQIPTGDSESVEIVLNVGH